jgi:hypothetical protein
LGRHESLLISGLFAAALHAFLACSVFPRASHREIGIVIFLSVGWSPPLSKGEKRIGIFKNASGIKPRLKIEELSVTLDLDHERKITVFCQA